MKDSLEVLIETYMKDPDFSNWLLYTLYEGAEHFLNEGTRDSTVHGLTYGEAELIYEQLGKIIKEIEKPVPGMDKLGKHLKRLNDE